MVPSEACTNRERAIDSRPVGVVLAVVLLAAAGWLAAARPVPGDDLAGLAGEIAGGARRDSCGGLPRERPDTLLASWQSVGGCGAGSAAGIGGIKWIGRSVSGGLFNVQCQANYTKLSSGYVYAVQNQITTANAEGWNFGAIIPYLYKYANNPLGLGFDLSNQGVGDVNLLVLRRFGAIRATTVTASLGLPTGTHKAEYQSSLLDQDRQLGVGKVSGALLVDHVFDNLWGPSVIGGTVSYPGGANDIENYRAPSASVYGYAGYLLGPLVPALGVSATAYAKADRDRGLDSDTRPPYFVALNGSLEWSTDWVALLAGVSLPFYKTGLQPWTVGIGLSLAPF
jgi:hypothetical protein